MAQKTTRRRVERLAVPRRLQSLKRGGKQLQLLDLSLAGARIEHVEPLPDWSDLPLDFSEALGGGHVRAEVVWSRVLDQQQVAEGKRWLAFQSGLVFPAGSFAEQAALTAALIRIAGEWALGMLRDLRPHAEPDRAHQERFDALCGEALVWLRQELKALRFRKAR